MRQILDRFRKVTFRKQRRKKCVFTGGVVLQPLGGMLWALFVPSVSVGLGTLAGLEFNPGIRPWLAHAIKHY